MLSFTSLVEERGTFGTAYCDDVVKNEPMFFNAALGYALKEGGPITQAFILGLPREFRRPDAVLDSRVHMLMPGWFPCIPGWHHDDVPRNTADGQPNYDNPPYRSRHCLALVNADVAPTEFLCGRVTVPEPVPGTGAVYKQWDEAIETGRADVIGGVYAARERTYYDFNCDTFHRGVVAQRNGWRWFGRVSVDTDRKPTNEIRRQVQVYMPTLNAGW